MSYIHLHQSLQSNQLWHSEPFSRGQAWVDLLMLANDKAGIRVIRGNKVEVKRGQVCRSVKELSEKWKWSRGKVDRFLQWLQNEQQIEQEKTFVTSLITIINYSAYQDSIKKTSTKRTADGQQKFNIQGVVPKQVTGVTAEVPKKTNSYMAIARDLVFFLNKETGRKFRPTENNLKLICERLKEPEVEAQEINVMIKRQVRLWRGTYMEQYLRIETLFGKTKFEGYYSARDMKVIRAEPEQRQIPFTEPPKRLPPPKDWRDLIDINFPEFDDTLRSNWKGRDWDDLPHPVQEFFTDPKKAPSILRPTGHKTT